MELGIGILGILIGLLIALIQARSPKISVKCELSLSGEPSSINCIVNNTGLAEAKNVYVGFNHKLLVGTKIFSAPEHGLEMHEANVPPDPNEFPQLASLTKAFSVRIPRISRKSEMSFQIKTIDEDNIRAAKQVLKISGEIETVLKAFGEKLASDHPEVSSKWDLPNIIQARFKEDNFFTPGMFSYSKGQFPIDFFTENENTARAALDDIYGKYKKDYIEIFERGKHFIAPVLRIKTPKGNSKLAIFPPYVSTFLLAEVKIDSITPGKAITVPMTIPKTYDENLVAIKLPKKGT